MKPKQLLFFAMNGIAAIALASCGPNSDSSVPKQGKGAEPQPADELVDFTPVYPKALFNSRGPVPLDHIKNLEKPDSDAVRKRLTFKVPKDTTNVALGKKVTSSDPIPIVGTLSLITNGDADGMDGNYVELSQGLQWIQIDLGVSYTVWKILLWHFHKATVVYFKTVVQLSDDPEFKTGVTTLFNNDKDNESKLDAGSDMNYIESNHGRLIEGNGKKGRYVRCWSNGNSANEMNHYIEVQVYGTPSK